MFSLVKFSKRWSNGIIADLKQTSVHWVHNCLFFLDTSYVYVATASVIPSTVFTMLTYSISQTLNANNSARGKFSQIECYRNASMTGKLS